MKFLSKPPNNGMHRSVELSIAAISNEKAAHAGVIRDGLGVSRFGGRKR